MSFPSSIEDPTLILSVTQIAQDDDGFDLASRDSLDLGEDLEAGEGDGAATPKPPAYDSLPGRSANNRDVSPLPAPIPQKPSTLPRESLDGEMMFDIGSEVEDDSDSDGEGRRLTKGGQ
jgi:hypothetical protein